MRRASSPYPGRRPLPRPWPNPLPNRKTDEDARERLHVHTPPDHERQYRGAAGHAAAHGGLDPLLGRDLPAHLRDAPCPPGPSDLRERFWSGVDLNELYRETPAEQETQGAEHLFRS